MYYDPPQPRVVALLDRRIEGVHVGMQDAAGTGRRRHCSTRRGRRRLLDLYAGLGGGAHGVSITIDGEEVEFSTGFTDLHTRVYENVLAGGGFGIEDARPSIELAYRIRTTVVTPTGANAHPMLADGC